MKKTSYYVKGMHCPSCEQLIRRKLLKLKGVSHVLFQGKKVSIDSKTTISFQQASNALQGTDYSLSNSYSLPIKDILWGVFLVAIVYTLLHTFSLDQYVQVDIITLPTAFVMGVLASFSSCMATSGGLLLGLTSGLSRDKVKNYNISFHLGRIISYAVGGLVLGFIGSFFSISSFFSGIFSFFVSIFMILIGLQLLGLIAPFSSTGISASFISKFKRDSLSSALIVGALTFFLPCGFTQSLQLYAISSSSPFDSMIMLLAFALGTMPALIAVGSFSQIVKSQWRARLSNIAAVIIIIIGFGMLLPSVTLMGFSSPTQSAEITESLPFVTIEDGYQIVKMDVVRLDYEPHIFRLQKDIPVKWEIDATQAVGCAKILTAPKVDIATRLTNGINIIEFTPTELGEIPFHCSMAMTTPGAKFIVE